MGAKYAFVTAWRVHAPVEPVWAAIAKPLEWPTWWKGVVAVAEIEPGAPNGLGALHRYTWKSALPYRLSFDMRVTEVDEPRRLVGRASGELLGDGEWTFAPDGEWTAVRYAWEIETTRWWMNLLSPLLRPAFEWNHDWVMHSGATGLAALLGVEVEAEEAPRKRRRWPLFVGVFGTTVGAVLWARRRKPPRT